MALGVSANMVFALAYAAPVMFDRTGSVALAVARFSVFGLLGATVLLRGGRLARLTEADWRRALPLSFAGFIGYYTFAVVGIRAAGAPLITLIVGLLPVTVTVAASWRAGLLRPRRLVGPLVLITSGLLVVNGAAASRSGADEPTSTLAWAFGTACGICALALWTWFALANAAHLRRRSEVDPVTWTAALGALGLVWTIPIALIAFAVGGAEGQALAAESRSQLLLAGGLLGLVVSGGGTLLWNRAAVRLSASTAGQLIALETVAALAYVYAWEQRLPRPAIALGAGLLLSGALLGVRAEQRASSDVPQPLPS